MNRSHLRRVNSKPFTRKPEWRRWHDTCQLNGPREKKRFKVAVGCATVRLQCELLIWTRNTLRGMELPAMIMGTHGFTNEKMMMLTICFDRTMSITDTIMLMLTIFWNVTPRKDTHRSRKEIIQSHTCSCAYLLSDFWLTRAYNVSKMTTRLSVHVKYNS